MHLLCFYLLSLVFKIGTNFSVGYLNMATKQIDIKNRTYYFYNDLVHIKNFDPNMLKLDKKQC